MSDRRVCPSAGYDFAEKADYREKVWSEMRKALTTRHGGREGDVVFFPSQEGLDIPVARKYRFRQTDLVAVERNNAVYRSATWPREYKTIPFYGVSLSTLPDVHDGKIVGAVLDFCSSLGEEVVQELASVWQMRQGNSLTVAFTLMGYRGTGAMNMMVNALADKEGWSVDGATPRLGVIVRAAFPDHEIRCRRVGSYKSGGKPVEWGVFDVVDGEWAKRQKALHRQTAFFEFYRRFVRLTPRAERVLRLREIALTYKDDRPDTDVFIAKARRFKEQFHKEQNELLDRFTHIQNDVGGLPKYDVRAYPSESDLGTSLVEALEAEAYFYRPGKSHLTAWDALKEAYDARLPNRRSLGMSWSDWREICQDNRRRKAA